MKTNKRWTHPLTRTGVGVIFAVSLLLALSSFFASQSAQASPQADMSAAANPAPAPVVAPSMHTTGTTAMPGMQTMTDTRKMQGAKDQQAMRMMRQHMDQMMQMMDSDMQQMMDMQDMDPGKHLQLMGLMTQMKGLMMQMKAVHMEMGQMEMGQMGMDQMGDGNGAKTDEEDKDEEEHAGMDDDMGDMGMGMGVPGVSADQFAPLVQGIYEGEQVLFLHTEASDASVAQMLTEMMGPEVVLVPELAEAPDVLLANVYVFINGIEGMGPFGFQPDIFDAMPGDEDYRPLRRVNLVSWAEGAEPTRLESVEALMAAEAAGDVSIEDSGIVVNMPILSWPGGSR